MCTTIWGLHGAQDSEFTSKNTTVWRSGHQRKGGRPSDSLCQRGVWWGLGSFMLGIPTVPQCDLCVKAACHILEACLDRPVTFSGNLWKMGRALILGIAIKALCSFLLHRCQFAFKTLWHLIFTFLPIDRTHQLVLLQSLYSQNFQVYHSSVAV